MAPRLTTRSLAVTRRSLFKKISIVSNARTRASEEKKDQYQSAILDMQTADSYLLRAIKTLQNIGK